MIARTERLHPTRFRAVVIERFPGLKLMISHSGGLIPKQIERCQSHREMAQRRIATATLYTALWDNRCTISDIGYFFA